MRALPLTAAYIPAREGGFAVEILEAKGVFTQGETLEEARENLLEVVGLMLEEAPRQFGRKPRPIPPGALTERIFVVFPA